MSINNLHRKDGLQNNYLLFAITSSKDATIADVWNQTHETWIMNFRRHLKDIEIDEWANFTCLLSSFHLNLQLDYWLWKLEVNGLFTTRSLLSHISSNNIVLATYKKIWKFHCPKRIKFLIWEICYSCLNTLDRLQIRCPWISLSPSWCCLCQNSYKIDELHFHTMLAC